MFYNLRIKKKKKLENKFKKYTNKSFFVQPDNIMAPKCRSSKHLK